MTVNAIVLIKATPNEISALGPLLTEIPGVAEAHSVAGSDIDLVAILRVADHEAIAAAVTEHISKLPGITHTNTMIAFRSYSTDDDAAAFEGFGD